MIKIKIIIITFVVFFFIFLAKQKTNENFDNNKKIPKIIIQTWKTRKIPDKYIDDVQSIKEKNPDFQYIFFTDEDIEKFIKKNYPQYFDTYQKLPVKIQKIDFFRYIAIYHYGGFYFDLDMECLKSLDDLLDHQCVFPIDLYLNKGWCATNRFKKLCEKGEKINIGQYAFGARPHNAFIKKLIDGIQDNIEKYVNEKNDKLSYIYKSTGPDFVTEVYLENKDKLDIYILYNREGQYFGNYAKHKHYGTWK